MVQSLALNAECKHTSDWRAFYRFCVGNPQKAFLISRKVGFSTLSVTSLKQSGKSDFSLLMLSAFHWLRILGFLRLVKQSGSVNGFSFLKTMVIPFKNQFSFSFIKVSFIYWLKKNKEEKVERKKGKISKGMSGHGCCCEILKCQ